MQQHNGLKGVLEPIPVVIGRNSGYTLDRPAVHHKNGCSSRSTAGNRGVNRENNEHQAAESFTQTVSE
ncbi:hypothetical protein MHYP_G00001060 [Metynnis hypsauchen]